MQPKRYAFEGEMLTVGSAVVRCDWQSLRGGAA